MQKLLSTKSVNEISAIQVKYCLRRIGNFLHISVYYWTPAALAYFAFPPGYVSKSNNFNSSRTNLSIQKLMQADSILTAKPLTGVLLFRAIHSAVLNVHALLV